MHCSRSRRQQDARQVELDSETDDSEPCQSLKDTADRAQSMTRHGARGGSRINFVDRGTHQFKGGPGKWRLLRVASLA
jgi:hypothetical protein